MVLHNIQKEIVEEEQESVLEEYSDIVYETNDNYTDLCKASEVNHTSNQCFNELSENTENVDKIVVITSENSVVRRDFQESNDSNVKTNVKNGVIEHNENAHVTTVNNQRTTKRVRTVRPKKFVCINCPESFYSEEKLRKHCKLHDSSRAYKCNECNKLFSKKSNLNIHLRSHTKEEDKKHSCKECGQQFTYSYLLKQHSYKHMEQKPFPCSKCNKGKSRVNVCSTTVKCKYDIIKINYLYDFLTVIIL